MQDLKSSKSKTHTTAVIWENVIPLADDLLAHQSKQVGFAMTRTQAINSLIKREHARLVAAGEIQPNI